MIRMLQAKQIGASWESGADSACRLLTRAKLHVAGVEHDAAKDARAAGGRDAGGGVRGRRQAGGRTVIAADHLAADRARAARTCRRAPAPGLPRLPVSAG
jgi:hypothetical protein